MSDEPSRRSRAWIGHTLLAILLVYPLAMGPAFRFSHWAGDRGDMAPYYIIDRASADLSDIRAFFAGRCCGRLVLGFVVAMNTVPITQMTA